MLIWISLLSLYSFAHAEIIPWKEDIPSSLQPFQNNPQLLASLAQNRIVIYAHPTRRTAVPTSKNPNPSVSFHSSAIVLPVSAANIEKTLTHYEQYVGLFPQLKSAKILSKNAQSTQVKYRVSIPTPVPVLNFNEDIIFQHQLGKNSLASIVIDAPIPYAIGKFEWFSLGESKTLVTLTQWGDLNQPKGFLISKILNALPEVKMGIPVSTNAFILESLRKRFSSDKVTALKPGQFPNEALSKAQLDKIAQISQSSNRPFTLIHLPSAVPYQHGPETMRFVTTYQYNAQKPQALQKWTQPKAYQTLFPRQIKSIQTTTLDNKSQSADIKASVGLGVITIPFHFKMNFSFPKPTENLFYANGGDLKYLKGQMQFNPQAQGTLLKMSTAMKIDAQAPFLLRIARSLPYHEVLPTVGANAVFMTKLSAAK